MDRFDKEFKDKLNMELRDIRLSEEVMLRIHEQVNKEKKFCFKDVLVGFLNYEIKLPYGTCVAAVALAAFLGISSFTVTDKDIASFMNRNIIEITEYWEEAH